MSPLADKNEFLVGIADVQTGDERILATVGMVFTGLGAAARSSLSTISCGPVRPKRCTRAREWRSMARMIRRNADITSFVMADSIPGEFPLPDCCMSLSAANCRRNLGQEGIPIDRTAPGFDLSANFR